MSKAKVIVLSVVEQGLSKAEAARRYEISWRWVHTLVQRYQTGWLLIDPTTASVIDRATGEILATCTIDPTRTYWRNNEREPGRWPGPPPMNDDAGHL